MNRSILLATSLIVAASCNKNEQNDKQLAEETWSKEQFKKLLDQRDARALAWTATPGVFVSRTDPPMGVAAAKLQAAAKALNCVPAKSRVDSGLFMFLYHKDRIELECQTEGPGQGELDSIVIGLTEDEKKEQNKTVLFTVERFRYTEDTFRAAYAAARQALQTSCPKTTIGRLDAHDIAQCDDHGVRTIIFAGRLEYGWFVSRAFLDLLEVDARDRIRADEEAKVEKQKRSAREEAASKGRALMK